MSTFLFAYEYKCSCKSGSVISEVLYTWIFNWLNFKQAPLWTQVGCIDSNFIWRKCHLSSFWEESNNKAWTFTVPCFSNTCNFLFVFWLLKLQSLDLFEYANRPFSLYLCLAYKYIHTFLFFSNGCCYRKQFMTRALTNDAIESRVTHFSIFTKIGRLRRVQLCLKLHGRNATLITLSWE